MGACNTVMQSRDLPCVSQKKEIGKTGCSRHCHAVQSCFTTKTRRAVQRWSFSRAGTPLTTISRRPLAFHEQEHPSREQEHPSREQECLSPEQECLSRAALSFHGNDRHHAFTTRVGATDAAHWRCAATEHSRQLGQHLAHPGVPLAIPHCPSG